MGYGAIKECVQCSEVRPHQAHGLCSRCYRAPSSAQYQKQYYQVHQVAKSEYARERRKKELVLFRARDRVQYVKHHPKRLAAQKLYREVNPEKSRLYYAAHKEYFAEHQRRNRRRVYESHLSARRRDPERYRGYVLRRRTKMRGLLATLTESQWEDLKKQYNNRCAYCGVRPALLVREHRVPVSQGGGYTKENIVPACSHCNHVKGANTWQLK